MSHEPLPLPMAPATCTLDHRELAVQLDRYRRLSTNVTQLKRDDSSAHVSFDSGVNLELLEETLATERACCSFFTLHYNPSERVLSITADPNHDAAIAVLLAALNPATPNAEREHAEP